MICSKCGASIPDEAAFCPQCGAKDPAQPVQAAQTVQGQFAQAQPAQNAQPTQGAPKANPLGGVMAKAKGNKKLMLGILGGAALIVIIIIIAVIAANAGGGTTHSISYIDYSVDGEVRYFYNGKLINKATEPFTYACQSANGKALSIIADGTLYYFKGTDMKTIAEDVDKVVMSDDGSTLAYLAENVISVYNGSSKKIAKLDDDESLNTIALSPNGSALVYFIFKDGNNKAYGWKGGKPVSLGSYSYGFISDGGSVFYGINDKGKICYVKNLDSSTKETLGTYNSNSLYGFTADRRGIIFRIDDKYRVFDPSFKDVKTFSADYMEIAYPSGSSYSLPFTTLFVYGTSYSLPSIKSFVMYSDSKLYRVTLKGGEYEKTVLARNVDRYKLSADGKTIIFKRNDTLYRASALKETENPEKLAEDVSSFYANSTLSAIYCTTFDDELLYIKGKGKTEKVESDCPDSFTVLENGVCFYTIDNEYKYSTGGKGKRCAGIGEAGYNKNYGSYSFIGNTVYAYSDGYIYTSQDGKKFTKTKVEYDY